MESKYGAAYDQYKMDENASALIREILREQKEKQNA